MAPPDVHPPPVARLRAVGVDFGGRAAISEVDLDVLPGEVVVIGGPNGAGKTTLLEVLAGTRATSSGTRVATGAIGFVPQRTSVPDRLPVTVRDVVVVGAWRRSGPWRRLDPAARADVELAMERLEITRLAERPFAALSGGQRQRALLAQGLASRAELLLLDEPTTGLDLDSGDRIRAIMSAEARQGAAVVCVSHDPAVLDAGDRLVRLADGRLVGDNRRRSAVPS